MRTTSKCRLLGQGFYGVAHGGTRGPYSPHRPAAGFHDNTNSQQGAVVTCGQREGVRDGRGGGVMSGGWTVQHMAIF